MYYFGERWWFCPVSIPPLMTLFWFFWGILFFPFSVHELFVGVKFILSTRCEARDHNLTNQLIKQTGTEWVYDLTKSISNIFRASIGNTRNSLSSFSKSWKLMEATSVIFNPQGETLPEKWVSIKKSQEMEKPESWSHWSLASSHIWCQT